MGTHRDLKQIAICLTKTHEQRLQHIQSMNAAIDSVAGDLRSPRLDGMPRASGGNADSIAQSVSLMELWGKSRDAEQARVDAVEWAFSEICSMYRPEYSDAIREAIMLSCCKDNDTAFNVLQAHTGLGEATFRYLKGEYISQVLAYLGLV